jgi:hypothetical protein
VANNEVKVEYKASGEMLADGLTKALPKDPFERFRTNLGIENVSEMVLERKVKALKVEDLEGLEDCFLGGEVEV